MLNKPNKWLNSKKKHLNRSKKHHNGPKKLISDANERLIVDKLTKGYCLILDQVVTSFLSEKGSNKKYIPTVKRAVPHLWDTSNGTFQIEKVGEINLLFKNTLLASQLI